MLHAFDTPFGDNRLVKLGYGAASPLWAPFVLAAGMGAGFWLLSQWTRQSFAARLPGAPVIPSPEPALPAAFEAPCVEAAPEPAPEAVVAPAADPLDADPVEVAAVAAERMPEAEPMPEAEASADELINRFALLTDASPAVLGETASFGDVAPAEPTAEPSAVAATDDGADLMDAAYARTLGPVPAPESPVIQVRGGRKRRTPPGVAPSA